MKAKQFYNMSGISYTKSINQLANRCQYSAAVTTAITPAITAPTIGGIFGERNRQKWLLTLQHLFLAI